MSKRLVRFAIRKNQEAVDRAVRGLVLDAYRNVELFHRRLDAASVLPRDIRSAADLAQIPIETRTGILDVSRSESLRRGTIRSACRTSETGGTTGTPLTIYMSRTESLYRKLLLFRALTRNARLSFPLRIAEVGAGVICLDLHRGDITQHLGVVRVTKISRALPVIEQVDVLLAASPQVIMGPPTCLELVAEVLQVSGAASPRRPRLVVSRGEILRPDVRQLLRVVFGCPVVDYYNCEEIGNIAWECPSDRRVMHISTDGCVVETVDAGGAPAGIGNIGDVVVTNLFNRTMPFIRYQLGDRASLLPVRECACGHVGASMSLVEGRGGDFLLLSSGARVSPRTVNSLLVKATQRLGEPDVYEAVSFQVQQDAEGRVTALVVPRGQPPPDMADRIGVALSSLDSRLHVTVEFVEEIPQEASGKRRTVCTEARTWVSGDAQ